MPAEGLISRESPRAEGLAEPGWVGQASAPAASAPEVGHRLPLTPRQSIFTAFRRLLRSPGPARRRLLRLARQLGCPRAVATLPRLCAGRPPPASEQELRSPEGLARLWGRRQDFSCCMAPTQQAPT